jgi:hypothetical protein
MQKIFLQIALIFAFIPNVSFSITSLDTQPFAAILGFICILIFMSTKIPVAIWLLVLPAFASFIIALASSSPLEGLRNIVIYSSPWIFACLTYLLSIKRIKIHIYIVYMLYLWCGVALIQWFFNPEIFEYLVNVRTTADRGVTSLAPEASFYGLAVMQMWLTLLMVNPDIALKPYIVGLCLFQIILMSQSTLAIFVLFLIFSIAVFRSRFFIPIIISSLIFITVIINQLDSESNRIFIILKKIIDSPTQLLYIDGSISDRFYHIFLSLYNAVLSGFMPHGFSNFSMIIAEARLYYDSFWWGDASNKIMSGVGGAFFELGFFSFIYFFIFYIYLSISKSISFPNKMIIGFGTFFILINSVTLSAPFFGIMIGFMVYESIFNKNNLVNIRSI